MPLPLRIRDKDKWKRVGAAIEDFIGNDSRRGSVALICARHRIEKRVLQHHLRLYRGINSPAYVIQFSPDSFKGEDIMSFVVGYMEINS